MGWAVPRALLIVLAFTAGSLRAQEPPPIVLDGLRGLVHAGIDSAVAIWLKGSPLEHDTASIHKITGSFTELPAWFGKPIDFELLKTYELGKHFRRTYATVLFEGGPMFFRFDYYLAPKGWTMQHLDFNTDRAKILPEALLPP